MEDIAAATIVGSGVKVGGVFLFEAYDRSGKLKWRSEEHNLVVNVGLNHILDVLFNGSAVVDPWYLGLALSSMTVASGDTMASHGGWTEATVYGTANRAVFVDVRTNQQVTNSASVASFSINTAGTIGGGFLVSDNTKNGTTGTLLCAVTFTGGDKGVSDGDTLNVTYNFSAADA